MNSHYCRVGTIKPNLKKGLLSKESEKNSFISETEKTLSSGKQLSK